MNSDQQKLVELAVRADTSPSRLKTALKAIQGEDKPVENVYDRYMDVKETCGYLSNISRVHLWHLTKKFGLPSHKIGNRLGFRASEINKWVSNQK